MKFVVTEQTLLLSFVLPPSLPLLSHLQRLRANLSSSIHTHTSAGSEDHLKCFSEGQNISKVLAPPPWTGRFSPHLHLHKQTLQIQTLSSDF